MTAAAALCALTLPLIAAAQCAVVGILTAIVSVMAGADLNAFLTWAVIGALGWLFVLAGFLLFGKRA